MARRTPPPKHNWAFVRSFRRGAFGWRSSKLACQRLREATSEIKGLARTDPVLSGEGAVRLMERLWPALEQVDSSSGALGTAVFRALEVLVPLVAGAPAAADLRDQWLERLFEALQEDGVDFLAPVSAAWGTLCGSPEVASRWGDRLLDITRNVFQSTEFAWFTGSPACLSALVAAGRYDELLDLLALCRQKSWHFHRFGVEALVALGRLEEALALTRALQVCDSTSEGAAVLERLLAEGGRPEDAYRQMIARRGAGNTWLARFRSVVKAFPDRQPRAILEDLLAVSPGEEGRWFTAARDLGDLALAAHLAERGPCDPRTLLRAADKARAESPEFARHCCVCALLAIGRGEGYDLEVHEVRQAGRLYLALSTGDENRAREVLGNLASKEGLLALGLRDLLDATRR